MRSFNSTNQRIQAGSKKKKKNPNGNHGDGRRRACVHRTHTHTHTGVRRDACYNTGNTFSSVNTAAASTHVQKKPFPPSCCCQHELDTHHVHVHAPHHVHAHSDPLAPQTGGFWQKQNSELQPDSNGAQLPRLAESLRLHGNRYTKRSRVSVTERRRSAAHRAGR